MIQRVECLGADLQLHCFSHRKLTLQSDIQRLPSWTIHCVATDVAKRKRRRRAERSRVEPPVRRSAIRVNTG